MKRRTVETVGELFETFLDEKRLANITPVTIVNYKRYFNLFNKTMRVADLPITEFSAEYLNEWYTFLSTTDVKPSTAKQYLISMKIFVLWLFDEGYIYSKPKTVYIKQCEYIPRYYSSEEVKALLVKPDKRCSFEEYSTYVMICFLLATGVRAATLVEIKVSDIDFDGRTITLRHLKNRKQVMIPLSDRLYKVLKEYLNTFIRESEDTYLFCTRNEAKIGTMCLRGRLSRYCKKRNVEFKDLHAFRHTFAKNYIQNGGSIEKLQKILTHKSLQMTAYYANIFCKDLQAGYEDICPLDSLFTSGKARIHRV